MQLLKEEYARKRIHNGCFVQIESLSLRITVQHHSASLVMLNNYRRERIFNPQLTAITNSYKKENVMFKHLLYTNIRSFLSIFMLHIENVIWPNLCYTQKYDI